jgi:indolepyruvate ferredoxin oxidoreductase beta subunit
MKNNTVNILFCGRGGQGVLKASEVVAVAAQLSGYHVKKSEVHGMSQRGGSVESHLRFGKEVVSPLIPRGRVDFLVSFDRGEHAAKKNFLKPKGADLVKYLEEAGSMVSDKRQVNVFLLGRLARYLEIDKKSWTAALERVFSTRYLEENKKAFYLGIGE